MASSTGNYLAKIFSMDIHLKFFVDGRRKALLVSSPLNPSLSLRRHNRSLKPTQTYSSPCKTRVGEFKVLYNTPNVSPNGKRQIYFPYRKWCISRYAHWRNLPAVAHGPNLQGFAKQGGFADTD